MNQEWVVVRLKAQDKAAFIADMKAAGRSVRGLGDDVNRTGGLFQTGSHHGFLWNQMLFTLRRTIYSVTLALAGMAAGAAVVGFRFNSMMEQQTLAFRVMTGSAKLASKEVNFLFQLAAHGPFQFQQVIQGARQLVAFGFTVDRTNKLLVSLQDAMAGMGLDQSQLDRATLALGQIQASGRLLGQDLRQLDQLGLVNHADFARRVGINPSQFGNIGAANIPSKVAIDAIMAYWKVHFKGAAKDFQMTWTGLMSTLKDEGSATFGAMVLPLQRRLERDILPKLIKVSTDIQQSYKNGGGFHSALGVINKDTGINLVPTFNQLSFAGKNLFMVVREIGDSFRIAFKILGGGFGPLYVIGTVLWLIGHALHYLKPFVVALTALWIIQKTVLTALWLIKKANLAVDIATAMWTKRQVEYEKLMVLWKNRERLATLLNVRALYAELFAKKASSKWTLDLSNGAMKYEGRLARLARYIFTGLIPALSAAAVASWSFTASLLANPITWIVLGVAALIAGLVVLYIKWKPFRDLINDTFGFIKRHALSVAGALTIAFGPIGAAVAGLLLVIKYWKQIKGIPHRVIDAGQPADRSKANRSHQAFGFDLHSLLHPHIPFLAGGGHVVNGGRVMVGERGPEVLTVPAGATVTPLAGSVPLASLGDAFGRTAGGVLELTVPLYLDRRKLAEANASVELDTLARR